MVENKAKIAFPPGITESDTKHRSPPKSIGYGKKYDAWREKNRLVCDAGAYGELNFYYTERFGWVITTLRIGSGRQYADRSYGISLKGEPVRVGKGPHVLATLRVLLYADRIAELQKYIDLYNKGLAQAGDTRDRISTRRMLGSMNRRYF